jgi:hypothetical protein
VTSIAETARRPGRPSWWRTGLLLGLLVMFALETAAPWGRLWFLVPAGVAVSLLAGWRYGAWAVLVPIALFAAALVLAGPAAVWTWWIPASALTGVWMGLREEGGGPTSGERAWMMLPVLLLAAGLPWTPRYTEMVNVVEGEMRTGDAQIVAMGKQLGYPADGLAQLEAAVEKQATLRREILPHVLPSVLFVWIALLVAAGRSLSSGAASALRWPPLSRPPLRTWRLPDAALAVLIVSLATLLFQVTPWAPSAWTLLLNAVLGYCLQGIAVVESLLLAKGVPSPIIFLTLLFVVGVATLPVFMLTTAAVGLSDVWLDYRRLEPTPDSHPEE